MSLKKRNTYYSPFDTFVFRAPLFPISLLNDVYNIGVLEAIKPYQDLVEQALYLASPNIHRKYIRRLEGRLKEDELEFDLILMKYIVRMASRCTPFGLFGGIGTGLLKDANQVVLSAPYDHSTHTKLSQDFLYHFYEKLKVEPVFLKNSIYHINNTLYHKQDKIRFTEYEDSTGYRKYTLSSVENNEVLVNILSQCEKGTSGKDILNYLTSNGASQKEARAYLQILVENQVIINDLEPCPVSDNMLDEFSRKIISKNGTTQRPLFIYSLNNCLAELDKKGIGLSVSEYKCISKEVKEISTFNKPEKIFHVDLKLSTKQATLDTQIISSIYTGLEVLNRLTVNNSERFMAPFRQKFYRRYEDQEIPLVEALDSESGIPVEDKDGNDINPLIDDIQTLSAREQNYIEVTPPFQILSEEFYKFLSGKNDKNDREMVLDPKVIEHLSINWNDLPPTFYVFSEIVYEDNKPLINLKGASGVSAANILARFHQASPAIKNLLTDIAIKEKQIQKDAIIAEIVHLPETRTGNVLLRPDVYDYQIPIVSTSQKDVQYQIPVTDLMISVPNGQRIIMRSKKLNKMVIPRLSSAQNFTKNSIPIYRFLSYIQMQGIRTDISFNWGKLLENRSFLPRVRYDNIILSPAMWRFTTQEISQELNLEDPGFHEMILAFQTRHNLPDLILLAKGDNKLLIDFRQLISCQLFYSEIKKKVFVLEEYFQGLGDSLIKNEQKQLFNGEYNLFFYRNQSNGTET